MHHVGSTGFMTLFVFDVGFFWSKSGNSALMRYRLASAYFVFEVYQINTII